MVFSNALRATIPTRSTRWLLPIRTSYQIRSQSSITENAYWDHIPRWKDVTKQEFINYEWQTKETVTTKKLNRFLAEVLPDTLTPSKNPLHQHIKTKEDFINDANEGLKHAPMTIRITPHLISCIDWNSPLDDPLRRQFIPLKSGILPDHPQLTLDSLNEKDDSPVPGLVHRYPGRALFLPLSHCPVYCRYCTRSWAVGADTDTVTKESQRATPKRWEAVFQHIEKDESLHDIVVSGGDAYKLSPESLRLIGDRLLSIPHIRRFRIASKGIAVCPSRILDRTDPWIDEVIALTKRGRQLGKQVCIHTHFNHPNEISWITRKAANYLFEHGVIVRNQSVLLRGVNDNPEIMGELINSLADMNIQPYYVYQCDLVRGIEDLRTPFKTILNMEKKLRGTITGFMMPSFIVDLPGGGGKRLASTYEEHDERTGVWSFIAPGLEGKKGSHVYAYHDPYPVKDSVHEHQKEVVEYTTVQPDIDVANEMYVPTTPVQREQVTYKNNGPVPAENKQPTLEAKAGVAAWSSVSRRESLAKSNQTLTQSGNPMIDPTKDKTPHFNPNRVEQPLSASA